MTRRRRDRDTDILAQRLNRAADTIPSIRDHLRDERHHISALRASVTDRGSTSGGTHSDPVLALVEALDRVDRLSGYIDDGIAVIDVAISQLERDMNKALASRVRPSDSLPQCREKGCVEIVDSNVLVDGTVSYRMGGEFGALCSTHRIRAQRAANAAR